MYQPKLRQGEELLKSSPDVKVKNVDFDAFLTDKRIIFAKKGDELYERKELVFPLGFIKDYTPSTDEKGIPRIVFSVQKPEGDKGDMLLNFIQKGDYRFAERDDWIEKLGRLVTKEPAPAEVKIPPVQTAAVGSDPFGSVNTPAPAQQIPEVPAPQKAAPLQGANPAQNSVSGQFCRFCGTKIPQDSAFCHSCGGKIAAAPGGAPPAPPQASAPPPSRPAYMDDMNRQGGGFVPPPPPQRQAGFAGDSYRSPPPPPSTGGYSLADDPGYRDYEQGEVRDKHRRKPDRRDKAALKEEKRAEKERQKEEARYRKEQKKANKNAGKISYDDYGGGSRIPAGLPKILIPVIIAVVVIGIVAFAFTSGMFGGSGGGAAAPDAGTDSTATDNTNSGTTSGASSSGTSQTTADYDKGWEVRVIYSGEWTGTFGSGSNMQTETGFGSQTFPVTSPSGSITATFKKADGGAGQIMFVDLLKDSKVMETGDTTDSGGSVTVTAGL